MKRRRDFAPWLVLFGSTVVGTVFVYLLVAAYRPPAGAPTEQDRIGGEIQAFREQHGRLPDSLQEAGIEFDRTLFDSVSYSKVAANPMEFTLSCTKDHNFPTPGIHWWYYQSAQGTWEYQHESI